MLISSNLDVNTKSKKKKNTTWRIIYHKKSYTIIIVLTLNHDFTKPQLIIGTKNYKYYEFSREIDKRISWKFTEGIRQTVCKDNKTITQQLHDTYQ